MYREHKDQVACRFNKSLVMKVKRVEWAPIEH